MLIILVFLLRFLTPVGFFPLSFAPFHRLRCSLASFMHSLSSPLLGFFYSDLAWLTSFVAPQPEVELIEPTSVASARYMHARYMHVTCMRWHVIT